jgi:hypothetical protein
MIPTSAQMRMGSGVVSQQHARHVAEIIEEHHG